MDLGVYYKINTTHAPIKLASVSWWIGKQIQFDLEKNERKNCKTNIYVPVKQVSILSALNYQATST